MAMTNQPVAIMQSEIVARTAAAVIALLSLTGLAMQLSVNLDKGLGTGAALWSMLRFLTCISNLAVVMVLGTIAMRGRAAVPATLVALATTTIVMVGVVFSLLLRTVHVRSGTQAMASHLLHDLVPPLTLLWWGLCAYHGQLTRHAAWRWLAFPLGYAAYVELRGLVDGGYPYGFMNPGQVGWGGVAMMMGLIGAGFLIGGYGLCWVDRWLGRRAVVGTAALAV
jgi:hypothetical protein